MANGLKSQTQVEGGGDLLQQSHAGAVRRGRWTRRAVAASVMAVSFAAGTGAASALIVTDTPDLNGPTVVSGAAFYVDGSSARNGPSGAQVRVFATSAEPGFAYKLVSARPVSGSRPCSVDVKPIKDTPRYANAEGVIAQTAGTLDRPAGEWQVCFLAQNQTVTGAVTYTVAG